MSLYGSLRTGVSGLSANSQRIAMISDNIANLNTYGYKRVEAQFSTFLTGTVGSGIYSSGGVQTRALRDIAAQGTIEISNNSTDMAIAGKGYFIVTDAINEDANGDFSPSGRVFYTRSGQFRVDADGNLRNSDGYYLLAWPPNDDNTAFVENSEIQDFTPINVANQNFEPVTTTELKLGVNLTTTTRTGPDNAYRVTQTIIDRQGTPRDLELTFERQPATGEQKRMFFDDGVNEFDVTFDTPQPEHWRVYAKVADGSVINYNFLGQEAGLTDEAIPVADLIFSASGSLDTVLPPGMVSSFAKTKFPLVRGGIVEAGSASILRLDLVPASLGGTRTPAEMQGMADVLRRYVPTATFSTPPTATEIGQGLRDLDTDENPRAMEEFYQAMTLQATFTDPGRAIAGLPSAFSGSIADMDVFGIPGEIFGTPNLGETTGDFVGGRIVSVEGDVRIDDNGLVKYARNGNDQVRINVDYNNDIASDIDQAEVDIDFGSMNFAALNADSVLNDSTNEIAVENPGTGGDGLTNYFDQISTVRYLNHNGKQFSALQSVGVDQYGVLSGTYDNGENRELYKVPLAIFANPNGMIATSGNAYTQSQDSGNPIIREAGATNAGSIRGFSLEASSVDVAQEFSDMIVTQRGYSAATKVITAADEMLRELASIR